MAIKAADGKTGKKQALHILMWPNRVPQKCNLEMYTGPARTCTLHTEAESYSIQNNKKIKIRISY